ncbi:response regulator receiver domain-containing protein [Krasilnikovia cinnamomea]|uniref:Response regulator receiver domain-containing protein n=1 Tax=Krasilnikovia cinnamomea TaxID=349313 RepID=A0A4Q7ZH53_9ACTN|nr:response regulator receiver domain-containing protein [Krasilnikovia cinnamomea]
MTDVRVVIADDHPVFREGLAVLLGSVDGVDVVGTAADGVAAVRLAAELTPDVVVMDVQMPQLNGVEATRRITAETPGVGVVVLTMSEDDGTVFAAVRAGARGYLVKGAEQEEIVRAITTVAAGGVVFGAALAVRIAEFFAAGPRRRPRALTAHPHGSVPTAARIAATIASTATARTSSRWTSAPTSPVANATTASPSNRECAGWIARAMPV